MTEELLRRLVEVIDSLAALAPQAWAVLRFQQYVEGAARVGFGLLGLVGSSVVWTFFRGLAAASRAKNTEHYYSSQHEEDAVTATITGASLVGILVLVSVPMLVVGLMRVANPDYYAIMTLIGLGR